jgi:hypothetical protein
MARRQRIDSIAGQVEALDRAKKADLSPPSEVPLHDSELPFFRAIVDHAPRGDWTRHGLAMAALLARDMAALERAQREARADDAKRLSASVLSWRRSLGLHARALAGGDLRTAGIRQGAAMALEAELTDDPDGLLN